MRNYSLTQNGRLPSEARGSLRYVINFFFRFEWLHLCKFLFEGAGKARTGGLGARRAFSWVKFVEWYRFIGR